jgi:hypothetical protein
MAFLARKRRILREIGAFFPSIWVFQFKSGDLTHQTEVLLSQNGVFFQKVGF